eukprot:5208628-Pyramimonas_sp.AAC.1
MAMELSIIAPPPASQTGYSVWDWGLLAAGLQVGRNRRELLEDLYQEFSSAISLLDILKQDGDPTRHAAV